MASPFPSPSASPRRSPDTLPPVLLLDLDDTILRFSCGQPDAWQLALQAHTPSADWPEHLLALRSVGHEYWKDPERAYWGRQNMLKARCKIARKALQPRGVLRQTADAIGLSMTLCKEAAMRPFAGAIEILKHLKENGHRLALLTNGCSVFQRRKLARFGLEPYFDLILIEGELGFGKPDSRVFEKALKFFQSPPEKALMVGDNLLADIAGAQSVGIPAVWNNCNAQQLPAGIAAPRFEIAELSDLLSSG